jgi:ketosteroid isomerase-like protein
MAGVMHANEKLIRSFHEAQATGNPAALMELLADDIVWHVPGRNLLSRDYNGKGEVAGFWGKARELSGGTVRTELLDVLASDGHAIALVRVHAEREGRSLGGQFQAFTYRIEDGKIAEFWFMVEDRYAVDAFWS